MWLAALAVASAIILALVMTARPADAATTSLSFEAEKMRGGGKVFYDRSASKNRAKVFYRNSGASKQVSGSIRFIAVRARGDRCGVAPRMKVMVDGKRVMVRSVKNQKRWLYYKKSVSIPDGNHKVTVKFINDRRTRKCDRNLRVDKMALRVVAASRPAPEPIALGAMIDGAPWGAYKIDEFTSLTGASPKIVLWYQNWEQDSSKRFDTKKMDAVASRGAMPMLTWVPKDPTLGTNQPKYALKTIARGDHDAYIRQWARDAKAWGKPFYLRPMHEMNGDWSPWCVGVNGNTSADYRAAWRHMHDIFRQEGTTNVRWVWFPNVAYSGSTPFAEVYPGDAYVDWMALDGYNFGTAKPNQRWRSAAEIFGPSYDALVKMTSKPMMIAETASAEAGGDKAAWIEQSLLKDIPSRLPRVRAVVWFHKYKGIDYRANSSQAALDAYKKVAASNLYQGQLR